MHRRSRRRRSINTAALALAVAAAACGGEPTAPQTPAAQGPRRTLTALGIELTAPTKVGSGEGCWYYANAYGGSGTYYIYWSGAEGYHYANDTQVLGGSTPWGCSTWRSPSTTVPVPRRRPASGWT